MEYTNTHIYFKEIKKLKKKNCAKLDNYNLSKSDPHLPSLFTKNPNFNLAAQFLKNKIIPPKI